MLDPWYSKSNNLGGGCLGIYTFRTLIARLQLAINFFAFRFHSKSLKKKNVDLIPWTGRPLIVKCSRRNTDPFLWWLSTNDSYQVHIWFPVHWDMQGLRIATSFGSPCSSWPVHGSKALDREMITPDSPLQSWSPSDKCKIACTSNWGQSLDLYEQKFP